MIMKRKFVHDLKGLAYIMKDILQE